MKAMQKLLLSLKTLPSFQQLKDKHLSHLLGLIGKSSSIQIGPASELVDSLDGSVWSEQDLVTLKSAITQKITSEGMSGNTPPTAELLRLAALFDTRPVDFHADK